MKRLMVAVLMTIIFMVCGCKGDVKTNIQSESISKASEQPIEIKEMQLDTIESETIAEISDLDNLKNIYPNYINKLENLSEANIEKYYKIYLANKNMSFNELEEYFFDQENGLTETIEEIPQYYNNMSRFICTYDDLREKYSNLENLYEMIFQAMEEQENQGGIKIQTYEKINDLNSDIANCIHTNENGLEFDYSTALNILKSETLMIKGYLVEKATLEYNQKTVNGENKSDEILKINQEIEDNIKQYGILYSSCNRLLNNTYDWIKYNNIMNTPIENEDDHYDIMYNGLSSIAKDIDINKPNNQMIYRMLFDGIPEDINSEIEKYKFYFTQNPIDGLNNLLEKLLEYEFAKMENDLLYFNVELATFVETFDMTENSAIALFEKISDFAGELDWDQFSDIIRSMSTEKNYSTTNKFILRYNAYDSNTVLNKNYKEFNEKFELIRQKDKKYAVNNKESNTNTDSTINTVQNFIDRYNKKVVELQSKYVISEIKSTSIGNDGVIDIGNSYTICINPNTDVSLENTIKIANFQSTDDSKSNKELIGAQFTCFLFAIDPSLKANDIETVLSFLYDSKEDLQLNNITYKNFSVKDLTIIQAILPEN
ncbi:hypothetical protein [Robinsoniella peoriensis]|uniref:Uncharacterized protein n=1 Tax=Robinsoniella peoriensis TaxID=180332 RepID=A0A4U8Q4B8_9FIRM|nr:hypothetical protein [Robinsoniella peoriensis]TLC99649.1 hypothetical protein DSM106044_03441 [Robinsoniella peoriensis]